MRSSLRRKTTKSTLLRTFYVNKTGEHVVMKLTIDRAHIKNVFKEYTDAYDVTDEKIKLKIDHTYRVAELCERIARSEGMPEADVELAWLLGMLHDVGRFEQLRRYGTFNDAQSVDHAGLGADILFGEKGQGRTENPAAGEKACAAEKMETGGKTTAGLIREYIPEDREDELIETAIRVHSAYRIPENLDARTEKLCHILRDADKIDILRVNVQVPLEEIYNTTTEELVNAEVTEAVMQSFYEHHATLRSLKRTPVDHVVGHISLVYELVFPESLKIVKEQGYLTRLLHFQSKNPRTLEQFGELSAELEKYMATET